MPPSSKDNLLAAVFDSWDGNNRILVNLLRSVPPEYFEARVMPSSPSIIKMFTHMLYVRLIFVFEDAPEYASPRPARDWLSETDPERIAEGLNSSARIVLEAVEDHLRSGQPMQLHYDHPLFLLQHMIWHEGYHHGQIKLALKVSGHPLDDEQIGPLTWGVWMRKTRGN